MSRGRGRRPERAAVTIVALLAAAHCWPRCFYAGTVKAALPANWHLANGQRAPFAAVQPPGNRLRTGELTIAQSASITGSLALASFLPPLLGLWQAEYGVSYGYGLATAVSGALLLRRDLPMPVALHAGCLCFYGVRLALFLLYRELCIARFREFRDKIETRSRESGGRLNRLPFLLSCAVLYLGLAAPIAMACTAAPSIGKLAIYKAAVALMCLGCLVAALGDAWKSVAKAKRGSDVLVTGGPFAVLRHPNYTGEQLLWTASFVAGLCAYDSKSIKVLWLPTLLSGLGWLGIFFVLMQATRNLERRQQKEYAGSEPFESWKSRTWSGFSLAVGEPEEE